MEPSKLISQNSDNIGNQYRCEKATLIPQDRIEKIDECYVVDGNSGVKYTRVSTLISSIFEPFNAGKIIPNIVKNPNSVYYGRDPKEIEEEWNLNGQISRDLGTRIHEVIESEINGLPIYIQDVEKDYQLYEQFRDEILPSQYTGYTKVQSEAIIHDDDDLIAGTIDALYYNSERNVYMIVDWKRSKIDYKYYTSTYRYKKYSKHELLKHLDDAKFTKYSLQVNSYAWILQNRYDMEVEHMLIVNVHPDNDEIVAEECLDLLSEAEILILENVMSQN